MKKFLSKLYKFFTKPFVTIAVNNSTGKIVDFFNKRSYLFVIIAFLLSGLITFLIYFLPYLK